MIINILSKHELYMTKIITFSSLSLLTSLLSTTTFATTGYFLHGYGVKAQGNAGTSIANFQDALTIAKNPAGLSWITPRIDIGATIFSPDRSAHIEGNQTPFGSADGQYDGNGRSYFVIPEVAYNHRVNDTVNLGIALYGNGGMNTGYKKNPYAVFGNTGTAGVDLTQAFISPAIAWKYSDKQSIAVATNILYQQFEAKGISGFGAFSSDGDHLSDRGKDSSTGIGLRVGWAAKLFEDKLTLGANYSSKIDADRFDRYRGLFAEQGDFDVPESYGIGIAYQFTPKLNIAVDAERINYSDVASVGRPIGVLFQGHTFGTEDGPGFGWDDINVYKIGATYQATPKLTLRAGYSYNDQPIPSDQTFLNILAPGVVQSHLSLGATWNLDEHQELSLAYTHALEKDVEGEIPAALGGERAQLTMNQNILGLAYGYKF